MIFYFGYLTYTIGCSTICQIFMADFCLGNNIKSDDESFSEGWRSNFSRKSEQSNIP